MLRFSRSFCAVAIAAAATAIVSAQVRDRVPARSTAAASDAAVLAAGWTAVANGQYPTAARTASQILSRAPWNHAATALRIEALAASDPVRGLDAYETWLSKRTKEDAGLLEPVPRAMLRQIVGTSAELRHEALHLLALAGVPMPPAAADAIDRLAEDALKAKDGDAAAAKRLQSATAASGFDSTVVAETIATAGPAGTPVLMSMLEQSAGPARAAAAAALGRRHAEEARPMLQRLMNDPEPHVRSTAAVALARMGDDKAMTIVERMLQSDVPDIRLMAAEAFEGQNGAWVSAVMPLLENRDGVTRIQAARLIAPVNPEAARRTLNDAAGDTNPVTRAEAAKAIEDIASASPDVTDLAQIRRLLRDADPAVRLHASGALLAAARGGL